MEYIKLGSTGLKVSRLVLGCMSFGVPERGAHAWTLGQEESRPLIRRALDLGINFFDTANVYSDGTSEEIVGRLIHDMIPRDEVVIATKVYGRMSPDPNGMGLSRKSILREIDHSLRRLGTDYIDLYQIHFWDNSTPIEETLEALNDVVKAGKVRYLGASNTYAWQLAVALGVADKNGWARFTSMQSHLNLLYREEEREMLPLCRAQGLGVITFSPLARGRLSRAWTETSIRSETDVVTKRFYGVTEEADRKVVEAVTRIAESRGVPRTHVAMAWVAQKPGVTAPIIGATKEHHLDDAVAALSLTLTLDEVAALEEPYVPHAVVGLN
jgi:aryl-alcohol dehydrogenase-like predicted oxidoreductase